MPVTEPQHIYAFREVRFAASERLPYRGRVLKNKNNMGGTLSPYHVTCTMILLFRQFVYTVQNTIRPVLKILEFNPLHIIRSHITSSFRILNRIISYPTGLLRRVTTTRTMTRAVVRFVLAKLLYVGNGRSPPSETELVTSRHPSSADISKVNNPS